MQIISFQRSFTEEDKKLNHKKACIGIHFDKLNCKTSQILIWFKLKNAIIKFKLPLNARD